MTHAIPYAKGTPTVSPKRAGRLRDVGPAIGYFFVQFATVAILYTGGNTSFNGFPYLTSFVAEDSFLPRQLTQRGHRLVSRTASSSWPSCDDPRARDARPH